MTAAQVVLLLFALFLALFAGGVFHAHHKRSIPSVLYVLAAFTSLGAALGISAWVWAGR